MSRDMRTSTMMMWVYQPGRPGPKVRRMTNREMDKRERILRKQIAGRHDRWSDEAMCYFLWGDVEGAAGDPRNVCQTSYVVRVRDLADMSYIIPSVALPLP